VEKEVLGVIASLLAAGISLSYIYTIVRGQTRPHLYTMAIDALISSIVFTGALIAGAGSGVWGLGVSTCLVFIMVLLCFKYGTKDVTKLDAVFALAACASVIPWVLTKDPTLSVILASLINLISVVPSFRKTWNAPYSEPVILWGLNAVKHVFAIAATVSISLATVFYPISIILMNAVFVAMILYRRKTN
jgi:hypothetical protein